MPSNSIGKMIQIMDMLRRQNLSIATSDEITKAISIIAGSRPETKQRYWQEMKLFKLIEQNAEFVGEWKLNYDEAGRLLFR